MKTQVWQIESYVSFTYREKKSRFVGLAFPVLSEEEARSMWNNIKKEYHDADHYPYAYVIGINNEIQKCSDDGEPAGTAGKPLLNALLSRDISYSMIIVVRYFGGTKLGTSGLKEAFKTTARQVLEAAKIVKRIVTVKFELMVPYEKTHIFYAFQQKKKIPVLEQTSSEMFQRMVMAIPYDLMDEARQFFSEQNFMFNEKEIYLW